VFFNAGCNVFLNPEKKLAQIRLVVFEKNANKFRKNDVTEPKDRLLLITSSTVNRLKVSFRFSDTIILI